MTLDDLSLIILEFTKENPNYFIKVSLAYINFGKGYERQVRIYMDSSDGQQVGFLLDDADLCQENIILYLQKGKTHIDNLKNKSKE